MFAAALNMDMIGRFNKTLVLQGVGGSTWWPKEIEKRNAPIGLAITTQNDAASAHRQHRVLSARHPHAERFHWRA